MKGVNVHHVHLFVTACEFDEDAGQVPPEEPDRVSELPVVRMHSCKSQLPTLSFQALTHFRFSQSERTYLTLAF